MNYQNLKITAIMQSNIVCDNFLPFDSILFYYAVIKKYGYPDVTYPGMNLQIDIELPIQKVNNTDTKNWYYAASWAYQLGQWWHAEGICNWTKSFDSQFSDYVKFKSKGRIEHKRGKYKAYNMPVFYKVVDKIIWYVVGNKKEIENILSIALYIGKKSSQGWGRVKKWKVEIIDEDYSVHKYNKLTRGIPIDNNEIKGKVINYGFRPSYWQKENQTWIRIE